MRTLAKLFGLGLLLVMAWPLGQWAVQRWQAPPVAEALRSRLATLQSTWVYEVTASDWLRFPLSGQGRAIRVLSNGAVARGLVAAAEQKWPYALDYRFVGSAGTAAAADTLHYRTQVTRYTAADRGPLSTRRYWGTLAQLPTDTRRLTLIPPAGTRPSELQLRLVSHDPALTSVYLRVAERETLPDSKLATRWQRLDAERKQQLAQGSVYGMTWLTEPERRRLMRQRWEPLGPLGVPGADFRQRRLFMEKETPGQPIDTPIFPAGVYADGGRHGTIPLPSPACLAAGCLPQRLARLLAAEGQAAAAKLRFHLELTPLEWPGLATGAKPMVEVKWYGPRIEQRATLFRGRLTAPHQLRELPERGLLEITATAPTLGRLLAMTADGEPREATPAPLLLRTYRTARTAALVYRIDHLAGQPTPVRLDLRRVQPRGEPWVLAPVRYQFRTASGEIVRQGSLQVAPAPSLYDWVRPRQLDQTVSEPSRYHWRVPAAVTEIRLFGPPGMVASLYTRPPDLPHRQRLPEETNTLYWRAKGQPAWFRLRPQGEDALRRKLRTQLLALAARPPQDDPAILAGRYAFTEYRPAEPAQGRYLLLPYTTAPVGQVRREALGSVFRRLPASGPLTCRIRGQAELERLEPTLIYLANDAANNTLQLFVDGKPWLTPTLTGQRSELRLPALPSGEHRFRLAAAANGQGYINYCGAGQDNRLRRFAYRLRPGEARVFVYNKSSQAAADLTLRWFAETGQAQPSRLRVDVLGRPRQQLNAAAAHTLGQRVVTIDPRATPTAPVLDTPSTMVYAGYPLFLQMGDDLPPGQYRLRVTQQAGGAGYVTLYQLKPGDYAWLRADSVPPPATAAGDDEDGLP